MYGHVYTAEQDNYIRENYTNVGECVRLFNKQFGTELSYSAVKTHALRKLGIVTGFRPWAPEMNAALASILLQYPYKQATGVFNERYGTGFTQKQIENHCTKCGIKREHAAFLKRIDEIIAENIDKTYEEIMQIVYDLTGKQYGDYTAICVRANNLGLKRPHRVWHTSDNRTINGTPVTFSEYVRFIGNRWHRIAPELQSIAMKVVALQCALAQEGKGK